MLTKKKPLFAGKNRFPRGTRFPNALLIAKLLDVDTSDLENFSSAKLTREYVASFCKTNNLKDAQ